MLFFNKVPAGKQRNAGMYGIEGYPGDARRSLDQQGSAKTVQKILRSRVEIGPPVNNDFVAVDVHFVFNVIRSKDI
jgi:hypothetical protein